MQIKLKIKDYQRLSKIYEGSYAVVKTYQDVIDTSYIQICKKKIERALMPINKER